MYCIGEICKFCHLHFSNISPKGQIFKNIFFVSRWNINCRQRLSLPSKTSFNVSLIVSKLISLQRPRISWRNYVRPYNDLNLIRAQHDLRRGGEGWFFHLSTSSSCGNLHRHKFDKRQYGIGLFLSKLRQPTTVFEFWVRRGWGGYVGRNFDPGGRLFQTVWRTYGI